MVCIQLAIYFMNWRIWIVENGPLLYFMIEESLEDPVSWFSWQGW